MTPGLYDCIGLPLETATELSGFIDAHWDEIRGRNTPDGWFSGRWRDESGAKFALALRPEEPMGVVPGYAGGQTALGDSPATTTTPTGWRCRTSR